MLLQARRGYLTGRSAYDPSSGGGLGLQTNLGSFFSLDNTLNDATGAVTALTNNNTVTFVSPPGGGLAAVTNCANFVQASSQYLSHADATGINTAAIDFSLQFWLYIAAGGGEGIASKSDGAFGNREYAIDEAFTGGAASPRVSINSSGTAITSGATMSRSAWHHVVITYVNSTKAMVMYIDGASSNTATAPANTAGTSNLQLGCTAALGGFWTGNMALFGTWRNRVLSAGDVTLLYNSGAGLSYAAMV